MNVIKLSYVITTYNKLPYLKEVMRLLLINKKNDEEIVIADGGSNDGTFEFLRGLYDEGKIDQFISEKDKGEAHGYNKTFMMAKGDLIKVITDDDVFNYEAINKMKDYMQTNPDIEVMCGNIISVNVMHSKTFFDYRKSYQVWFEQWANGEINSTFFSCLPLLIRRKSIPLLGLFDTTFKHVDLEYSVRLTSQKRKVAFYTDIIAIGLVNEKSISAQEASYTTIFKDELVRLDQQFNYEHKEGLKSSVIPWIRSAFFQKNRLLWKFADKFKLHTTRKTYYPQYNIRLQENMNIPANDIRLLFEYFEEYIKNVKVETEALNIIVSNR